MRFSIIVVVVAFAAGIALSYFYFQRHTPVPAEVAAPNTMPVCTVQGARLKGFQFIKPLLYINSDCASPSLSHVKSAMENELERLRLNGQAVEAGVYLRHFETGEWTGVGENQLFHPGSLFKLPMLVSILKKAEKDPGLLDRQVLFQMPAEVQLPVQNYTSHTLESGKKYSIRDLLRYMVAYSDNKAQWLLSKQFPANMFDQVFTDFGISTHLEGDRMLKTTPQEYALFFRTLFNGSYLNFEHSEFALSLLSNCTFQEGFAAGLPKGIRTSRKFGEWDDTQRFELHETGIIYLNNQTYLLSIMTRGASREALPPVLRQLSRVVYDQVKQP
jgi:beta-lactamase class A